MATETKTIEINWTEIVFYPNSHKYKIFMKGEGVWIPSVTGICGIVDKSRWLMIWATKLASEYLCNLQVSQRVNAEILKACDLFNTKRDEALDTGTIVHDFCENYVKSQMPDGEPFDVAGYMEKVTDEAAINGISAFVDWCTSHDIVWQMSERMVYSKQYNYVGTFDALAIIDGKRYLIDFKTSTRVNTEYGMQTAAYVQALCEELWLDPLAIGRTILRFDKKTGAFERVDFENYENDRDAFNAAIVLKNAIKNIETEIANYGKSKE